jgi:hypothetical protein
VPAALGACVGARTDGALAGRHWILDSFVRGWSAVGDHCGPLWSGVLRGIFCCSTASGMRIDTGGHFKDVKHPRLRRHDREYVCRAHRASRSVDKKTRLFCRAVRRVYRTRIRHMRSRCWHPKKRPSMRSWEGADISRDGFSKDARAIICVVAGFLSCTPIQGNVPIGLNASLQCGT